MKVKWLLMFLGSLMAVHLSMLGYAAVVCTNRPDPGTTCQGLVEKVQAAADAYIAVILALMAKPTE